MNTEALILSIKILVWVVLVYTTIRLGVSIQHTYTYPGSVEEMFDKLRHRRKVVVWWPALLGFVVSFLTIAALWGR